MDESTPSPRNEVFMYLDIVVDWQKRVVASMDSMATRLHDQSGELTRITRRQMTAEENQIEFRSEVRRGLDKIESELAENRGRFVAVGKRFEEIEKALDQLSKDLHDARIEIVSQNNETINAVHAGLTVQIKLDEILERLQSLEARLPPRNGTV